MRGGPPGDLYVVLHLREHELFSRQGDDLLCSVPVAPHLAALGGELQVPTPDGLATLKLPQGTPSGKVFRLRGKGVPSLDGRGRGDLHVRIEIEVPAHLSSAQRKALQSFADTCQEANFPGMADMRRRAANFMERRRVLHGS